MPDNLEIFHVVSEKTHRPKCEAELSISQIFRQRAVVQIQQPLDHVLNLCMHSCIHIWSTPHHTHEHTNSATHIQPDQEPCFELLHAVVVQIQHLEKEGCLGHLPRPEPLATAFFLW